MKNIEGTKDYKYVLGFIPVESSNVDKEFLITSYNIFIKQYESFVDKVIFKNIVEGLNSYKS